MTTDEREVRINLSAKGRSFSVFLTDEKEGFSASSQLSNLSRTGMFLEMDSLLKKGRTYQFNIRTQKGKNILGRLHVRWNRTKSQGPYFPKGIGVKVVEFFEETESHHFSTIFVSFFLFSLEKGDGVEFMASMNSAGEKSLCSTILLNLLNTKLRPCFPD